MSEENNEKSALVPRLRFPEFLEAGEWTSFELGNLSQLVAERVGTSACIPYTITTGVGLVSQEEKLGRTIAGNSLKNYIVLQKNDFAYNKSATKAYPQGFIACYVGKDRAAVPNSVFTCFRLDQDLAIPAFLDKLFSINLHGRWLRNRIAVGARAHGSLQVNDDDLMAIPVPLPSGSRAVVEQQKIADCLSSLDELIKAETQKLDALKTHKKGLMQQLFPREGETVPRIRFSEFRKAEEWKEIALGDVCERIMDGTHFSPASKSGPFLYLTSKNVRPGALVLDDVSHISADEHRSIFARCPVKKGDLLLTKDGASTGNCTLNPLDFEFSLLSSVAVIRGAPNKILQEFLAQDFQSRHVQDQIADAISGQAITRITLEKIKLFKVWLTSPQEQQRISDFLTSLDELVSTQSQKIAALKTHKKGLSQQLFPVLEEMQP